MEFGLLHVIVYLYLVRVYISLDENFIHEISGASFRDFLAYVEFIFLSQICAAIRRAYRHREFTFRKNSKFNLSCTGKFWSGVHNCLLYMCYLQNKMYLILYSPCILYKLKLKPT
jgi:hypothetical protein